MRVLGSCRSSVLLAGLVACSSGDGGGGPNTPAAASLSAIAGNNQVGPAGAPLAASLAVVARDAASNPVAGVTVQWAVGSGGGSVSSASSVTDATGTATTSRTLGPNAGTQTTTATVSGLAPVTFQATAQIQGATQMALSTGNGQSDTVLATLATPLAVLVRDQNGAAVGGVTVNWTASGGSVSAPTSVTNASGIATITRTFGSGAGLQAAQAAVTGLAGSPVVFVLTATPGNASTIVKFSGDGATIAANGQVTHTVLATDAYTNARSGVTVNWTIGTGGGTLSTMQSVTAGNGTASTVRTLGDGVGTRTTLAAADPSLSPASLTFTTVAAPVVVVGPGITFAPATVTISAGGSVLWQWAAANSLPHNVTFAGGAITTIDTRTAGTEARVFAAAGTYSYECTIHGSAMAGQVVVNP
jgi:plastocyanin